MTTFIVVLLCLAVAARELYLAFDRRVPDLQSGLRSLRSEVRGVDERVGELHARLAAGREQGPPARTPPDPDALAALDDRLARLEAAGGGPGVRFDGLAARITALEESGATAEAAGRLNHLSARVAALEDALTPPDGAPAPLPRPRTGNAAGAPAAQTAGSPADLAERVAALEARAGGAAAQTGEDDGGLAERVAVLEREREGVRALARSLDAVESTVGGLRRELFDRLDRDGDTVHGLLLGVDPVDEPLLAAVYERCAAELGLRVLIRESVFDPPWSAGYRLSGRPPAEVARELLAAAREADPGSAPGALLAALGEQAAGVVRLGAFTAVRTGHGLLCGLLDDLPARDPETLAPLIADLPAVARADLSRLLS